MTEPDIVLSDRDIEATNVRPAFEASLRFGATEEEIERRVGWRRVDLSVDGAAVSGESTYLHMELMAEKPDFSSFILAAVALHNASGMGVVGLACRSCSTMEQAFACHQRFQHLTNRTAEYTTSIDAGLVTITENRFGEARRGSLLVSDYTMLIALHLLRNTSAVPLEVHVLRSRRNAMPPDEIVAYEKFAGAPVELGVVRAQLVLGAELLRAPVKTADKELADYFQGVLRRAASFIGYQPSLLDDVSKVIRDRLVHGAPTAFDVARSLGLGHRTFQRRLKELGQTFVQVLETTRRELAAGYLADPTLSLSEVAYLLGYTENASFHRAFRRWYGATPAEYRKKSDELNGTIRT